MQDHSLRLVVDRSHTDSIGRIADVLMEVGIAPPAAREAARGCWNRTSRDRRAFAVWYAAEAVWRRSMGDEWGTRSMLAFAEGSPAAREQVMKILRDVDLVLLEADRYFADLVPEADQARTRSHLAGWLSAPSLTLQQKAQAVVARMVPPQGVA